MNLPQIKIRLQSFVANSLTGNHAKWRTYSISCSTRSPRSKSWTHVSFSRISRRITPSMISNQSIALRSAPHIISTWSMKFWRRRRQRSSKTGASSSRSNWSIKSHSSSTVMSWGRWKTTAISTLHQFLREVAARFSWFSLVRRMRLWRRIRASLISDRRAFQPRHLQPASLRRESGLNPPLCSLSGKMMTRWYAKGAYTSMTFYSGSSRNLSKITNRWPWSKRSSMITSTSSRRAM